MEMTRPSTKPALNWNAGTSLAILVRAFASATQLGVVLDSDSLKGGENDGRNPRHFGLQVVEVLLFFAALFHKLSAAFQNDLGLSSRRQCFRLGQIDGNSRTHGRSQRNFFDVFTFRCRWFGFHYGSDHRVRG